MLKWYVYNDIHCNIVCDTKKLIKNIYIIQTETGQITWDTDNGFYAIFNKNEAALYIPRWNILLKKKTNQGAVCAF